MLEKLRDFPSKRILTIISIISTITTIALFLEMRRIDALLMRSGHGIVDFELAFYLSQAIVILREWLPDLQAVVKKSLFLDFGFIVAYSFCLAGIALLISRAFHGKSQSIGFAITFLPLIAACLDIIENILLLHIIKDFEIVRGEIVVKDFLFHSKLYMSLLERGTDSLIFLAGFCASMKFMLLGIVFIFIILGGGNDLFSSLKSKK